MRMNFSCPVTLYHYDEKREETFSFLFPKAKVHGTTKIGDLSHGRRSENSYIIRIMTDEDINVSCGDEVYSDLFGQNLTVVGISDNRRGSKRVRHFKLIAR